MPSCCQRVPPSRTSATLPSIARLLMVYYVFFVNGKCFKILSDLRICSEYSTSSIKGFFAMFFSFLQHFSAK